MVIVTPAAEQVSFCGELMKLLLLEDSYCGCDKFVHEVYSGLSADACTFVPSWSKFKVSMDKLSYS